MRIWGVMGRFVAVGLIAASCLLGLTRFFLTVTVEVTNNEKGPSRRKGRMEEEEDKGKPLSRAYMARIVVGKRVEEEVEAQDATIGEEACSASKGEKVDVGGVGGAGEGPRMTRMPLVGER